MQLEVTQAEVWLVVVLAIVIYALVAVIFTRRPGRAGSAELRTELTQEFDRLQSDLAALQRRVDQLEGKAAATREEAYESVPGHYDSAVQYAREGMAASEIAARCGISQDEATLIVALHGKRQAV